MVLLLPLLGVSNQDVSAVYPPQPLQAINMSENTGHSSEPRIVTSYYDNLSVVWSDLLSGEIMYKASQDGGKSFGPAINLSNSTDPSLNPHIATWSNHVYVVWDDKISGNDEVMFAASNDSGASFGQAVNLSNSFTSSTNAKVALPESSNNVYVVWIERNRSSGFNDVFLRISKDNGLTFGDVLNLSNNENANSSNPQVAASYNKGQLAVTWETTFENGNVDVFLRQLNDDGHDFGNTVNLSKSEDYQSTNSEIAVSERYVFVAWQEHNAATSNIFFTRVKTSGGANFDSNAISLSKNGNATSPQIAASYSNSVHVMWHETTKSGEGELVMRSSLGAGDPFMDKVVLDDTGMPESSHLAIGDYYVSAVWQHDGDIFFTESVDAGRTFGAKANLSSNTGNSYSPQVSAYGPKVVVAWIDDSFGSEGEIAFVDATPIYYFEYPLNGGFRFGTDNPEPIMTMTAGDNVTITALVDNYGQRIQADASFITQVLNEDGVTESIFVSNVTVTPDKRFAESTYNWVPQHSGQMTLEGFVWSKDGPYPLAPKIEGYRVPVGLKQDLQYHDLSLQLDINQTSIKANGPINGSLYLVNKSNHSEYVKVDEIYDRPPTLPVICSSLNMPTLNDPIMVPAHDKVNLSTDNTIGWAFRHPGTYNSTKFAILSAENPDGKARCLQVMSNTIAVNVMTPPMPAGIELALTTDKQVYVANETVHFDIYVDNTSNKPLELTEFALSVYIMDSTGKEILSPQVIASSTGNTIVEPHSKHDLNHGILSWDQMMYSENGELVHAPVGEYTMYAEYWSPYLKSNSATIALE